jgi:hypothetical protein
MKVIYVQPFGSDKSPWFIASSISHSLFYLVLQWLPDVKFMLFCVGSLFLNPPTWGFMSANQGNKFNNQRVNFYAVELFPLCDSTAAIRFRYI